jgi:hypothetical protein
MLAGSVPARSGDGVKKNRGRIILMQPPQEKQSPSDCAETRSSENDPLLALRGSGKELWADEHADEYVRRLREGWE